MHPQPSLIGLRRTSPQLRELLCPRSRLLAARGLVGGAPAGEAEGMAAVALGIQTAAGEVGGRAVGRWEQANGIAAPWSRTPASEEQMF